jgi:hypothetical protein
MVGRVLSSSDRLRHLAGELETLADAMARPSRTTARSDLLIAECERIAADVRAVVRGPRLPARRTGIPNHVTHPPLGPPGAAG